MHPLILFLALFLSTTGSVSAAGQLPTPFHYCDRQQIANAYKLKDFTFQKAVHGFTNRSLDDLFSAMPPLAKKLWDAEPADGDVLGRSKSFLDIGCGNGKTVGAFVERFPKSRSICINKSGYEFHQVENTKDWLARSVKHGSAVVCDENKHPIYPTILMMDKGVTKEPIPIAAGSLDFVMSMYALDSGKIYSDQLPRGILDIVALLKVQGHAYLHPTIHLAYFQRKWNMTVPKVVGRSASGIPLGAFHLRVDAMHQYTGQLFLSGPVNNLAAIIVKRCVPYFYDMARNQSTDRSWKRWGCFTSVQESSLVSAEEQSHMFGALSLKELESLRDRKQEEEFAAIRHVSMKGSDIFDAEVLCRYVPERYCAYYKHHADVFFRFLRESPMMVQV